MIAVDSHKERRVLVDWEWTRNGWQSGNVRIVSGPNRHGYDWETWYVKVRDKGRWKFAYCEQRRWGYGSPGQAKRGVSKWTRVFFWPGKPWEVK